MLESKILDSTESQTEFINEANLAIFKQKDIPVSFLSKCQKCQNSWSQPRRIFICNTCQNKKGGCMCTECFLKIDHTGHDYFIESIDQGSCDCGDSLYFSTEHTCPDHRHTDTDEYTIPINVINTVKINMTRSEIVKWLYSISFNKSIRQIFCKVVNESIPLQLTNWERISSDIYDSITKLYLLYIQECEFAEIFCINFLDFMAKYLIKENELPDCYDILSTIFLYSSGSINRESFIKLIPFINDFMSSSIMILYKDFFQASQHENFFPLVFNGILSLFNNLTSDDTKFVNSFIDTIRSKNIPKIRRYGIFKRESDNYIPFAIGELLNFLSSVYDKFESLCIYINIESETVHDSTDIKRSLLDLNQSAPIDICTNEYLMRSHLKSGNGMQNIGQMVPFIRFFSLLYLAGAGFYVRNCSRELILIESITTNLKSSWNVLKAFEVFQDLLQQFDNQEQILYIISRSLGVFSEDGKDNEKINSEERASIYFSFFHFIASIVTNRKPEFIEETLKNYLFDESMSANQLFETFPREFYSKKEFKVSLEKFTTKSKVKFETVFKLKPQVGCNIYQPWIAHNVLKRNISKMIASAKGGLIPFPEYEFGSFDGIFNTRMFYAASFMALLSFAITRKMEMNETVHIIIRLLRIAKEVSKRPEKNKIEVLMINNETELEDKMPSNYEEAMSVRIIFDKIPETSLRDLVELTGEIGRGLLASEEGAKTENENENKNKNQNKNRNKSEKAQNLRNKILQEFNQRSNSFHFDEEDNEADEKECEVCHCADLPLYFPLSFLRTSMASFIDGVKRYDSYGISFCQHLIHKGCAIKLGESFVCPVDRIKRQIWLPFVQSFDSSVEITDDAPEIDPLELAAAIGDCLAYLEFRANAEAIESFGKNGQIRSLFAFLRTKLKDKDMKSENPFVQFIIEIAQAEKPPKEVFENLREEFAENNPVYATRTQLLAFTIFGIDSVPKLKPNIKIFEWLPKNFFDLMLPPLRLPLLEPSFNYAGVAICLLTRQIVAVSGRFDGAVELAKYIKQIGGAGVLLSLGGQHATRIQVVMPDMTSIFQLGSPYVDSDGDCDIGMRRGRPLSLSNELLEGITDSLFSMSFINQQ